MMPINQDNLSVRRIKEFGFFINEKLFAQNQQQNQDEILKIDIALQLSFTIETNLVFLLVRVHYYFPDSTPGEVLSEIQVQNVFEFPELKKFQTGPSEIILPPNVITTIVGLSISHTRALFAKNISGTLLQENMMAIVDPTAIAKHFFPKMFEGESATPKK